MKATLTYGAGDVRIAEVPDPVIHAPADAIVRVVRAAICGSDLAWCSFKVCTSRICAARRRSTPGSSSYP
jgi:D-arabinose 1-dehydrogenase-like Zn-dependent alcohol dehydrogenase